MPSKSVQPAAAAQKLRPISAEHLYNLRQLTECQLSPDGRHLLTAVSSLNKADNKGCSNLFLVSTDGGKPRQFTRGEHGDSHARFSPDGSLIAFISGRSGGGNGPKAGPQIWLIPVDGGEAWQLTKLEGSVSDFVWSPDGRQIALVFSPKDEEAKEREKLAREGKKGQDEPLVRRITRYAYRLDGYGWLPAERSQIHIADVSTGKTRRMDSDDKDNHSPSFTPDGKWVVYASNKADDPDFDFLSMDLWKMRSDGTGRTVKVETFEGPANDPAVSPDGKWVAFRGWAEKNKGWAEAESKLWVVALDGKSRPVCLSESLDRGIDNTSMNDTWGVGATDTPVWAPDSSAVYSVVTDKGSTHIYRFPLDTRKPEALFSETGVVLGFAVDELRDRLYCSFCTLDNPGDLYSRRLRTAPQGAPLKQLTRIGSAYTAGRSLGAVEEVWVRGTGGHKVQGWVMTPPGFSARRKYPAVLYIHGGPHLAYSSTFFNEFQYLAGEGYVVMYCNPRGSTGYGEAHKAAIARAWGGHDYDDVMSFCDGVVRDRGFIDKERLVVAGGSYGGYMTNWIIGHTHKFKAAISDRCVSNFMSFFGSCDFGYAFHREFGNESKSVWEDRERFIAMSPIAYLHKAKTPTLVVHQEQDLRCPTEQGEQVYVQLKLKGVDTELLRYPQESHGMSRGGRPDRRIHRLEAIKNWFDKYVKK